MNRKDIVERLGRRAPGRRTSTPRSDFDLDPLGRPVETRSLRSAGVLRDNELVNDLGGLSHPLAMASVSSISRQSLRKKRLMCRDPTINRQNLPSDEAGCIRCEENDSFCDINRSANPWHECMALHHVDERRGHHFFCVWGKNKARKNGIASNASFAKLAATLRVRVFTAPFEVE